MLVKEEVIDTCRFTLENRELKLTNTTQKRKLSRQMEETDTLTKRILILDEKNSEQRRNSREQLTAIEELEEKMITQCTLCRKSKFPT